MQMLTKPALLSIGFIEQQQQQQQQHDTHGHWFFHSQNTITGTDPDPFIALQSN